MLRMPLALAVLLLDEQESAAAQMRAAQASFWRSSPGGGMTIARDAIIIELNARQSLRVESLLGIRATSQAAALPAQSLSRKLCDLLDVEDLHQHCAWQTPSSMSFQ